MNPVSNILNSIFVGTIIYLVIIVFGSTISWIYYSNRSSDKNLVDSNGYDVSFLNHINNNITFIPEYYSNEKTLSITSGISIALGMGYMILGTFAAANPT